MWALHLTAQSFFQDQHYGPPCCRANPAPTALLFPPHVWDSTSWRLLQHGSPAAACKPCQACPCCLGGLPCSLLLNPYSCLDWLRPFLGRRRRPPPVTRALCHDSFFPVALWLTMCSALFIVSLHWHAGQRRQALLVLSLRILSDHLKDLRSGKCSVDEWMKLNAAHRLDFSLHSLPINWVT